MKREKRAIRSKFLRPRGALLAGLAVACLGGCIDAGKGHFAEPGFADGEVKPGDLLFTYLPGDQEYLATDYPKHNHHVVAVRGDVVDFGQGFTAHRREVVPASHLRPGVWVAVEDPKCPSWVVATAVTPQGVSASCKGATVTWGLDKIYLPTRARLRLKTRNIVASVTALIGSIGALTLAFTRQSRAEEDSAAAQAAIQAVAGAGGAAGGRPQETEILRCGACGAPVPLSEQGSVACRACGAAVAIPPAYGALLAARRDLVARTTRELSALRAAGLATHPAGAVVLLAIAAGLALWLRGHEADPNDGIAQILLVSVIGGLTFGLPFSAIGQLLGFRRLRSVVPELQARLAGDGRGFDCRSCGAPLRGMQDGAEVCLYCGAQNLIESGLTQAAAAARAGATASTLTFEAAIAQIRQAFWTALTVPFFYGGFLGLLVSLAALLFSFITYP
jgi:DNA-directed RNA polymerase subunit RPC12/RpoP